jgi:predicted nucleic acid-binding protein
LAKYYTRLKLLSSLKKIIQKAIISNEILKEYSLEWSKKIPKWIEIKESKKEYKLENVSQALSQSDLSIIKLALEFQIPIASDDKILRNYAKNLGIGITGSLGLLKILYQKAIIKNREAYMKYLFSLQEDVYISDDLMRWALED